MALWGIINSWKDDLLPFVRRRRSEITSVEDSSGLIVSAPFSSSQVYSSYSVYETIAAT